MAEVIQRSAVADHACPVGLRWSSEGRCCRQDGTLNRVLRFCCIAACGQIGINLENIVLQQDVK
jgi:hypothetical protein